MIFNIYVVFNKYKIIEIINLIINNKYKQTNPELNYTNKKLKPKLLS